MTNFIQSYFYIIKNNVIKQMRSYSFLIVIGLTLFLGYFCVPAASDGYQIFYLSGIRGVYNSAWLGGMAAMLSSLLLWLFGFYMLRSQISDDERLKVGPVIASAPISKLRYIASKTLSNFIVLITIESILLIAFMVMQLLRGEDYYVRLWDYIAPFIFNTCPSLFLLSALTVLFDVIPGFKHAIGNITFFFLWIFLSVISIASPHAVIDLFGLDSICSDMVKQAALQYPHLADSLEGGSFGYYVISTEVLTFNWGGVHWTLGLLIYRLVWMIAAILIIVFSSLLFKRFKPSRKKHEITEPVIYNAAIESSSAPLSLVSFKLSAVKKDPRIHIFRLTRAELRIMRSDLSIWWLLLIILLIVGSLFAPLPAIKSWLPLLMVLPLSIWSQMGTREKYYSTAELIGSSCPPYYKWLSVWLAGIIITFLVSAGVITHFVMEAQWALLGSWGIAVFFLPTLALISGSVTKSRKFFEVIYILWWYLGPINNIPYLDFLGLSSNHSKLYLTFTFILLTISLIIIFFKITSIPGRVCNEKHRY